MTNFVYDNVALPDDKVNSSGGSEAVSNPTRRWSPNDANRVFQALRDVQTILRDNTFNVRAFGAVGNGSTDDYAAIQDAIDAAEATVTGGAFGAAVLFPKGTWLTSQKLVQPNGVAFIGAGGPGGPVTAIQATNAFSDTALIENENLTGGQEFAFLSGLRIIGNKGGGAVCSVAVVNWVSLFVNSVIRDCIIEEGSNVGLRIAADGTPGGMGPVYVVNAWVARCTGHNVLVEDTVANTGSPTGITFMNLTSENQGTNKSAVYLKGNGRLQGCSFLGQTHIEMGNPAFTGRTGVTFDGCAHSRIDNLRLQADAASISEGVNILNVVTNVGIKLEHVTNNNLINPVIRDQKNSVTIGAVNVHSYVTADWQYQGQPKFLPPSSGKAWVAQSSAGTDRLWPNDTGQLTGASLNGAGVDIKGDETNNRVFVCVPNTASGLNNLYGAHFPSGGGGVLRFTYFTGSKDVYQVGTDGSMFIYEASTLQKNTTFQQGIRLQAEIAPAQITANQNNYSPTGLTTATTLLLTSDASRDITGIASPASGIVLWIYNIGAQNIVLKHESASSTAANRIIGTAGADVTLTPNRAAMLRYSNSQTRWLVMTDNL